MSRFKTAALLISLAAVPALLAPGAAEAKNARATFSVKLEAHRTVTWDVPRTESGGDCNGKRYSESHGSEDYKLWSGTEGRLLVEGSARRLTTVEFGLPGGDRTLLQSKSPSAKSVITRARRSSSGTTGGWCGGAQQDPPEENDCGTKLVPFTYRVSIDSGKMRFVETRGWSEREKYSFYKCGIFVPEGMYADSMSRLEQTVPLGQLFDKRRPTITIEAEKTYGPTFWPLGSSGVKQSASGSQTWKITLTRVANLEPRAENG